MCMQDNDMRLSWWLGRFRRVAPLVFVVILILLYYKLGFSSKPAGRVVRLPVTDPPLPPPVLLTERPVNKWSKWVVIRSRQDVCNTVSLNFPGWVVLIVGTSTQKTSSFEYCVYKTEEDLFVWRNNHISEPIDSLHVNVLANLYAIKNGAEYIYLPGSRDHWTETDLERPKLFAEENHSGLLFRSGKLFDTEDHFGCRRRHPDAHKRHGAFYSLCFHRTPGIQVQTNVRVSADRTPGGESRFPVPNCDPRAPPVSLPAGALVEFEPHKVLYIRDAFWALPFLYEEGELPLYKTLVWGLLTQRILWLSGNRLMIHSVNSTQEGKLSIPDIERVKLTLEEWKCGNSQLVMCIMQLVKVLVEKHVVDGSVGPILHEWLRALNQVGYEMPQLSSTNETCVSEDVIFRPVDYSQLVHRKPRSGKPLIPVKNVQDLYRTYQDTCSQSKQNKFDVKINFTHPWVQFENVLLVVTFNNPHYESIPFIETLYRAFFPYMMHCGPGLPNFTSAKMDKLKNFDFTFYSYGRTKDGHVSGAFNYECVTSAINMHFPVEGYLVISDDLLVSVYKTFDLRRFLSWYVPSKEVKTADITKLKECRLGMCDFYPHWYWWEAYQTEVLKLLSRMEREQYSSSVVNRCYRQLMVLNGGQHRVNGAYSDIYYIPDRIASEFSILTSLFLEEDIFLEIAIPSILRCLENTDDMEVLRGIASWEVERDFAWVSFTKQKFLGKSYLHPTKWSYLARGVPKFKDLYCDKILPYVHDRNGRLVG